MRISNQENRRPDRSISVSTPDNINAVRDFILSDRRIGLKRLTETIGKDIIYEHVYHMVHVHLDIKKNTKWIHNLETI